MDRYKCEYGQKGESQVVTWTTDAFAIQYNDANTLLIAIYNFIYCLSPFSSALYVHAVSPVCVNTASGAKR